MTASLLLYFGATGSATCDTNHFFGFVPWYEYLQYGMDSATHSCGVLQFNLLPKGDQGSDLPLIFLALIDDLLRVAGLAAVAFIIYGAIQYVTSQGNADQASKAQGTVTNALLGLVIAIIGVTIVSFIGRSFK